MNSQEEKTTVHGKLEVDNTTIGTWQFVMLFLCAFVLATMAAEALLRPSAEIRRVLALVDTCICVVFLGDFFVNLVKAESKLQYLKWGWVDFVSSIPSLSFLRWGRLVRAIRLVRLLRLIGSTRRLLAFMSANRAQSALAVVAMFGLLMITSGAIGILQFETAENSNIRTGSDAIWWAFVTVTTVGYGDFYPTTTIGRLIATVLMTVGIGIYSTLTAYVASYFVENETDENERKIDVLTSEVRSLRKEIKALLDKQAAPDSPTPPSDTSG
jgi:voltage-gated potassium channel